MENKLFHGLLTPILINWIHSLQAINALLSVLVYDYFFIIYFLIKFYALAKDKQIANANTECIP